MFIEQPKQKVSRPTPGQPGCWVVLRVPSTNRSFTKTYVRCTKKVRSEKLTCTHHDKWEGEAQELKNHRLSSRVVVDDVEYDDENEEPD